MKKLLGTILGLALLLAVTGQAQASSSGNSTTGPGSVNIAKVKNIKITKTATLQGALVFNNVNSFQGTGGNQTNGNTVVGGGSTSGGADNGIMLTNNVNTARTTVTTSPVDVSSAGNSVTGPGSVNVAKVENVSVTKTATVQLGVVVNNVSSFQGTGGNQTNGNTVAGGGSTSGDACLTTIIDNNVNSSTTVIN